MGEPDRTLPDDPQYGYRAPLSRRGRAWVAPAWLLLGAGAAIVLWIVVR